MKLTFSALFLSSALILGCSGGGSGGHDLFGAEYNPQTVPANPAPKAYLESIVRLQNER